MTTIAHIDVIDSGLNVIVDGTLSLVFCQTEPLSLGDCETLSGSGGKRISTVQSITGLPTVEDGVNAISRRVVIPYTTFTDGVLVAVSSGTADLWLAVYDDTRLLLRSDQVVNEEMVLGATLVSPTLKYGVEQ